MTYNQWKISLKTKYLMFCLNNFIFVVNIWFFKTDLKFKTYQGATKVWKSCGMLQKQPILNFLPHCETHDGMKDMTTWAQERFGMPWSLKTGCLQIIASFFFLFFVFSILKCWCSLQELYMARLNSKSWTLSLSHQEPSSQFPFSKCESAFH